QSNFPKFKKKGVRDTYRSCVVNNNIRIEEGFLKLPKIGLVEMRMERDLPNNSVIKSVTITKTKINKYFVSIQFEFFKKIKQVEPKSYLGLDYSSPYMYIDSNGKIPDIPKPYRQHEPLLAKEQRKLSRMIHNSNNYKKQLIKINKIYEKIANIRKDFAHKISRKIANSYDVVCVEDLDLVEISKNQRKSKDNMFKLGKATYDNGWGMTRTMIEYKLKEQGKYFIKANKWFPSTQQCSSCKNKNEIDIKEREYQCECGLIIDRDLNAALNLKQYAIEQLARA
ncbi:MAG TPA: transposase, partial [Clostridiales bacterium]|nr:transposase [Clostridiales bacterium]